MSILKFPVTTVILSGGQGIRIGGDKGLKILHGRALISWVIESVSHDSEEVLINANASQDVYSNFGCRVIADQITGWPGPLAGLEVALSVTKTQHVLSVPCDTPFLPDNLLARLSDAHAIHESDATVAVVAGRRQPTIVLYNKNVLPLLRAYLASGKRKVNDWLDDLRLNEVMFDNAEAFENLNTQEDLARANRSVLYGRVGD